MQTVSLYRKYRPKTFNQIIGQELITKTLRQMIIKNNINQSYIFCGMHGTGKTSIAKILAKAINCLNPIDGDACNKCENCEIINNNKTVDINELDAASNNGVDEIRVISDNANYLPINLKYKIYIIDEAHMLTNSAWNALLKTIEEPPKHAVFIFATTEYNKIPNTIVSRCQRYDFKKLFDHQIKDVILNVCNNENIKIDDQATNLIIDLADGSARDCLSILDQLNNYSNSNIVFNDVKKIYGLLDNSEINYFIKLLFDKDIDTIKKLLEDYTDIPVNFSWFLQKILKVLVNNYLDLNNDSNIVSITLDLINYFNEALGQIKIYNNAKFYLELAIYKFLANNKQPKQNINNQINNNKNINSENNINNFENEKDINNNNELIKQISDSNHLFVNNLVDEISKPNFNLDKILITKPYTNTNNTNTNNTNTNLNDDNNISHNLINDTIDIKTNKIDQKIILKNKINDEYENDEYLFYCAANFNNKNLLNSINQKIDLVKNDVLLYDEFSILSDATKAVVCSDNVLVILFDISLPINAFNQLLKDYDFINKLSKFLDYEGTLLLIDNKKFNEYKNKYKNNKEAIKNNIKQDWDNRSRDYTILRKEPFDIKKEILNIINNN